MAINNENYYTIHGFMLNKLQLKGIALNVYAIIYGFSQDGQSEFKGSRQYLCDFTGTSKPTIDKALDELVEKNFIIKRKEVINSVTFNHYKANLDLIKNFTGGKESLPGVVKNLYGGGKESLHNNIIDNIDDNYNTHTEDEMNPQAEFFEKWNVTTDDLDGRTAGMLSTMDFEKLNAAMEKSKSFLQTQHIARYSHFYIKNYKKIIAGYYDDDKHEPRKGKNTSEPTKHLYDMEAIKAEDRSGGLF